MINRTHLLGRVSSSSIGFVLICIALVPAHWSSKTNATPQQEIVPQIINETHSLEVLSTKQGNRYIEVLIRNISQKNINGYSMELGDGGQVKKDLTIGSNVLAPGAEDDFIIPLNPQARRNIKILAVMFDDGTFEGDSKAGTEFEHVRLGSKIQLKRILALLQKLLNSSDANVPAALDKFKEQISSLKFKSDEFLPYSSAIGLHNMKQEILVAIQELQQNQAGSSNSLELLIQLKKKLDKRQSSLGN